MKLENPMVGWGELNPEPKVVGSALVRGDKSLNSTHSVRIPETTDRSMKLFAMQNTYGGIWKIIKHTNYDYTKNV